MALREAWTSAPLGKLPPKEQAKLWALREVLLKQGEDPTQYEWMAERVNVVVESGEAPQHPSRQAVRQFFLRVDEDKAAWYPGSTTSSLKLGRPVEMTPLKRKSLATAMMAAKKKRRASWLRRRSRYMPARDLQ